MTVSESKTKICVIGMGYVGIPVAALLAEVDNFEVFGLQRKSKRSGWKIEVLNSGKSPFEGNEPGLDELISKVAKKGTFKVTDDPSILKDADFILIDVQTPTDGPNRQPQYNSLRSVCESIGKNLIRRDPKTTIIVESTVAPGTTENIVRPIIEEASGLKAGEDFYLAFSYERVMPGRLIEFIVNSINRCECVNILENIKINYRLLLFFKRNRPKHLSRKQKINYFTHEQGKMSIQSIDTNYLLNNFCN